MAYGGFCIRDAQVFSDLASVSRWMTRDKPARGLDGAACRRGFCGNGKKLQQNHASDENYMLHDETYNETQLEYELLCKSARQLSE